MSAPLSDEKSLIWVVMVTLIHSRPAISPKDAALLACDYVKAIQDECEHRRIR